MPNSDTNARFDRAHRAATIARDALASLSCTLGNAKMPRTREALKQVGDNLIALHKVLHEEADALNGAQALPAVDVDRLSLADLHPGS